MKSKSALKDTVSKGIIAISVTVIMIFVNCVFYTAAPAQPNVLVILLDDARYDMFGPNGGPDYFQTPSINKIAEEGVNFKYACHTTPLCAPSRASIYTGLYSHHHGAFSNADSPYPGLTYVSSILKDAGYYTGFVGKWLYQSLPDTPVGFNYYASSKTGGHSNLTMEMNNGGSEFFDGHDTEIFTDLAIDFLDKKVPSGKPWLLFVCHQVPHTPYVPRKEDKNIYDDVEINFPDNFYEYSEDFPSYLYPDQEFDGDSVDLDAGIRDYYETCHSAEYSTDSILSYLISHNLLDNTLIIFTSDNGYLQGEHYLDKKLLGYEESLRAPLFLRYPAWFTAGTVIDKEIAANIDIAPTIIEAAGLPDTFDMDGISLKKLAKGTAHRKFFFYENYAFGGRACEGVRSLNYMYIYSYCNSTTEEFFDLTIDLKENTNLIFDPGYATLIEQYRQKRLNFRTSTGDTITPNSATCFLASDFYMDQDVDTYGNPEIYVIDSMPPSGYVVDNTDCNDNNSSIHPGAADLCNNIDDDCDQQVDENALIATISPVGTVLLCKGKKLTLSTNTGSGISYQWLKNGAIISGATKSTFTTKQAGNFQVSESNNFNCDAVSPAASVVILNPPNASITPLGDLDICLTDSVALKANGGTGLTYQWKKNGVSISGATMMKYTATTVGEYRVKVTASNGCTKVSEGVQVIKSCKVNYTATNEPSPFSVYPNPTDGTFTIYFLIGETPLYSTGLLSILNILGQVVYHSEVTIAMGEVVKEIDLDRSLTDGMYVLRLDAGDQSHFGQLVLQK